ncbi:MAG TPA: carboxypeptidase-like regulatory domain-containing protein, partial [Anaerolineales bacterium]
MKTPFARLSILLVVTLLFTSCGPSPEQITTMTASAWTATPQPTSTPTPTLTPTPIPYDLTISVVDEAGAPIAGATIVFPESGSSEPVTADATGKYNWTNLPGAG